MVSGPSCVQMNAQVYVTFTVKPLINYIWITKKGKGRKSIKARECGKILEAQIETGNPYMLYKDAANAKSNQQNLGTIRSSNLCTEIWNILLRMKLQYAT